MKICLQCAEDVTQESINPSYNGMAIHYGQDWYCGPVVDVADENAAETLKTVQNQSAGLQRLNEIDGMRFNRNWARREKRAQAKAAADHKQVTP